MKFKRIITSIFAAALLFGNVQTAAIEVDSTANVDEAPARDLQVAGETDLFSSSMISLPQNLRGTIITPEVDFILSEDDTETEVAFQVEEILKNAAGIGLNTLIINTSTDSKLYYNLDMNKTSAPDFISLAIELAHAELFNVFLVYDVNPVLADAPSQLDGINKLVSEIHRFTIKYPSEGIILDDYYAKRTAETYGSYMQNGSGIGYDNWLYDSTEYLFETAGKIIHMTDNAIPVGIMINDVWANATANADGSATSDEVQAYYDGFSDTKKYIEMGYADFVMMRSYGSIADESLPFKDTADWWGRLCDNADIPLYLIHYNEKMFSGPGWNSEDQLLKQLAHAAEHTPAYQGSVFNSYKTLLKNPTNTTTTLTKYFENQINVETLDEELIMKSPKQLKFTTYEPVVDFQGTFDENFDVYFNDSKIKLNEAGNFYFEEKLAIGQNTFKIKHKAKTYTYKIERKIITMKELDSSIADGKTLRVEGETSITISALAYKGATVVATLNGQTITLKESASTSDDNINSSYTLFIGKYKAPEGIIEVEQPLGKISVTASYQGYSRTMSGAAVIVNGLPRPQVTNQISEMYDQNSVGTGEVVGTISPYKADSERTGYVRTIKNHTSIYDAKTTGETLNPDFGQVPAGTLDYLKSTQGNYYITESGKRFKAADVTVFEDTGIGENKLFVSDSGTSNGESYFKMKLDYKISYNVQLVGHSYSGGSYDVANFNATHVYITFDNVTSVTKLPSFESNLVFGAGKWEIVNVDGVPKFRLVLELKQAGVYAGNGAYYDSNGDLVLTFQVPTNTIQNLNIVIDPGHGYGKNATTFDPGAIGHVIEQEVNLAIAKKLTSRLQSLGVNSVRLKTESTFILTASRPAYARNYGCDMFLSIHANRVQGNDTARGTEVYYYTPFSQPLARSICNSVSSYFTNNVYEDGADKNRGAKYSTYWVTLEHDFPSVLIETGFVSNMEDAMALANSDHQSGIANAIIQGISNYLARSNISYGSSGSNPVTNPDPDIEYPAETETPDYPDYSETSEDTTAPLEEIEEPETESTEPEYFEEEIEII